MYQRWQLWLGIPALGLAALLLTSTPAAAQRWGRGGGGHGYGNNWNNGFYGNNWNNGYYGNNWNNGFYGNGYYGNNGWYGRGYYGNGYGNNGYYGNNWNNNGYYADYEPNYYYGQTPQYQQGYSAFYPSQDTPQNAALVHVQVPPDAELWFGGDKTSQTGPARDFVTPELKQDKNYFYTLKARWTDDNGKAIERTKRVQVRPGSHVMVDFNRDNPPERTEKRVDTPDRGENREEGRQLQQPTEGVKPNPDRTPAKPVPNTPRNNEAVP